MNVTKFQEDTTLEGRRKEIEIKVKRVYEMLDKEGLDALLLTKHSNFSWITAGGKSSVTLCVSRSRLHSHYQDELYAITSVIEARRYREEEQRRIWIQDPGT